MPIHGAYHLATPATDDSNPISRNSRSAGPLIADSGDDRVTPPPPGPDGGRTPFEEPRGTARSGSMETTGFGGAHDQKASPSIQRLEQRR